METFKFKHPRRVYLYTLLSFLMCMLGASSMSGRTPRNPIVKLISGPTYSDNGTEVTLKLWMYNYDGDNAYFLNNVMLRIDDKDACTLNNMWNLISNVHAKNENNIKNYEKRGNVGSQGIIKLDGVNVGTAQFCNAQKNQTCPYNGNTGETKWTTIELKLSFNNSFSYRKHTVSVKGLWRDRCDDNKYSDTTWDLKNTLHGFVYPTNLDISRIGYDVKFTWEYSGSETNETRKGKWVLYKIENGKCVKQVEDTSPYRKQFTIPDKDFRCLATYYLTFQPNALNETTIITGLTKSYTKGSHDTYKGECKYCKHGIFSYTTTDGKTTPLASNMDFGSKILSHTIDSKGTCIIEFEGKFTRIPDGAFKDTKINSNTIEIPETVTSIGSYAFANTPICGSLIIPNSVTEIKEGAFENCRNLNSLKLPSNLKRIESLVFKSCGFSGSLTIPNSVTEIGERAFYDCKGFNGKLSLPCNLSKIGNNAFYGCENLSGSLTIPETVKEIGILAFCNCTGFTGDFVLPSALESIGINAFGYTQEKNKLVFQSLPKGMRYSYSFCNMKKCVNLSDASYVADDATVDLDEASYSRTMSNTWGTLMLPYKITLTGNEPYSLYKIETLTGNELVLSCLEGSVAAGTPCIVKRNGTEAELTFGANDAELNMAIATTTVGGMTFRGTYWTEEVNSGYVISKDCFWNVEELKNSSSVKGVKVRPFRAWLDGTSANASAQLSMRIDGSTTGIDAIDALNDAEAEYYDLSGKRLDEPQRGVNIVRMKSGKTKKIIIK